MSFQKKPSRSIFGSGRTSSLSVWRRKQSNLRELVSQSLHVIQRVSQKHRQRLVCYAERQTFFKTEPLSGIARFGRCRASKCPLHMSSIIEHVKHIAQSTLQTWRGFKLCTSYVTAEPPISALLSFTHMIQ